MNKRNFKRVLAVFMSFVMIVTGLKLSNRETFADPYTLGHNTGDTLDYIEQSYYELDEYNQNDILGAAQRFLLFGRESVKVGVHTNGNLASPILITKGGGTFTVNGMDHQTVPNGNYRLINYLGELQTEDAYGNIGLNGNGYLLVIGQSGTYASKNPKKIDGKDLQGNWEDIVYANPAKAFLDFDKEFAHLERLSQALSEFTGDHSKTVSDIHEGQAAGSGQNHILEVESGVTVLSLTGTQLAAVGKDILIDKIQTDGNLEYHGQTYKQASKSQVVIINVDLNGSSSYNFEHEVKYRFVDDTVIQNMESTIYNGNNILWNFYDSSDPDGLFKGTLSFVNSPVVGTVLAPAATVRARAVNGTVIGKNVETYGAEVHRSDFMPTSIPGLKMYKITYDPNASDASLGANDTAVTDATVYEYNELATILNNNDQTTPGNWRRDGYRFIGWSEDASVTTPTYVAGDTIKMDSDKTLYAIWKETYKVIYNANGGQGTLTDPDSPYITGTEVTVLAPGQAITRDGYDFKGWNTDPSAAANGTADPNYDPADTFTITQDTYLYAVWEAVPTYTVTYHANITLTSGSAPEDPDSPYYYDAPVTVLGQGSMVADHYTFLGWNMNEAEAQAGTVQYGAGDGFFIAQDTDLYGVWKEDDKYTVTYHPGITLTSGSAPVDAKSPYYDGDKVTILGKGDMEAEHYTFQGWNMNEAAAQAGTVQYGAGDSFFIAQDTDLYGVWKEDPKYTVTYDPVITLTSGSAPVDSNSYYYNTLVDVLGQGSMASDDYVFKGWNRDENAANAGEVEYIKDSIFQIQNDTIMYAVWEPKVTVTYHANISLSSGSEPVDSQSPYEKGKTVTILGQNDMVPNGDYVFLGWNTNQEDASNGAVQYSAGDTFTITADTHLYGVWEPKVTVTYHENINLDSGSAPVDSQSPYENGDTVTVLGQGSMVPSGNYVFKGWNTNQTAATNGTVQYAAGAKFIITENTDLYGVWEQVYTVTYDKNLTAATGSQTDDDSPYAWESNVTVLDQGSMAATDYVFKGWNTDQDAATNGTVQYNAGDTFVITGDVTLYAVWKPTVTVTYHANIQLESGSAPVDSQSPYESGSDVTILGQGNMVPDGNYVFKGWNTDASQASNGVVEYSVGATFGITSDTNLYGVWVPQYTVTYHKNLDVATGSQTDDDSPYESGKTVTVLDQGNMEAVGYIFRGWNTDQTAATNGTVEYIAGNTFEITRDTPLYAVWEPKLKVTYYANIDLESGSAPVDAQSPYESGSDVTVLGQGNMVPETTDFDYEFRGWNTDETEAKNGTVQYTVGQTFNITADTDLYAVWVPQYTVTYHKNLDVATGSQTDDDSPYERGKTVTVLDQGSMKAEGYTFKGWNTDQTAATNGTVQYNVGATFTINQNTVLYAVWEPKVNVTYHENITLTKGSVPVDANSPYEVGKEVTVLDEGTMVVRGYTFFGWNTSQTEASSGIVQYGAGDTFDITEDTNLYAVWKEQPKYTVTYDKNLTAATGEQTDTNSPYYVNELVTVLGQGEIEAEGYTFKGWNTDADAASAGTVEYIAGATFTITDDTILYAVWEEIPQYSVTYNKNLDAATGTLTDSNSPYYSGTEVTVLHNNGFTAVGYKFLGWSQDENATTPDENYDPGDKFTITANTVFYAVWEPLYTVTYDKNLEAATGSQTDKQGPYTSGSTVTVLDQGDMAAEGYTFEGWNTDKDSATAGTVEYTANDTFTISGNTTLYAVWKVIPTYKVVYEKNLEAATGTLTDANSPYYSGTEVTVLSNTGFTAVDYKFLGWSKDQNATAPDENYDPGDKFTITEDTIFYAVWQPLYRVTYDKNLEAATGSQTDKQGPYTSGNEVTVLDQGTMAAEGYAFKGWNTVAAAATAGTVEYAAGDTFTITKNTTLYAVWETIPQYSVTYNKNLATATGSVTDANSPYYSGTEVTVLANDPDTGFKADGYKFLGWSRNASATTPDTDCDPGDKFTITGDTEFYAVWMPLYTVTYKPNIELTSGSAPTDTQSPYEKDSEVTVLGDNGMTVTGLVFNGWNTDSTAAYAGTVEYVPGATFTITADTVLYGVWSKTPQYTVTYNKNLEAATGSQTDSDSPYFSGSNVTVLNQGTMAAEGYTFKGWNTDQAKATAGTVEFKADDTFKIAKNTILYAVWEKVPTYTVTYVSLNELSGGSVPKDSTEYKSGETVTVKDQGTMEIDGMIFLGWTMDADDALNSTPDSNLDPGKTFTIKDNTTLYAVFKPVVTVTYHKTLDSASEAPVDPKSPYGVSEEVVILDQGSMKAEGYTFIGWNMDEESAKAGEADPGCAPGVKINPEVNVDFYAVWKAIPKYEVTYDKNLASATGSQTDSNSPYESGSNVTVLNQGTMAAEGYTFKGWNTDQTKATAGTVEFKADDTFKIAKNTILYAVWEKIPTYTVTYDKNLASATGSQTDSNSPYESGSNVTVLNQGTMKADNYDFLGWNTDQTKATAGTVEFKADDTFEIKNNTVLYAVWERYYTVDYDAAGGNNEPEDTKHYHKGDEVTVPQDEPEKDGEKFVGWTTDPSDPDAKVYKPGDTVKIGDKDITFTAVYTPTYSVTYDKNLDAASAAPVDGNSPYTTGSTVTILGAGDMKADGYVFVGWSRYANETSPDENLAPGKTFTITQDEVFYAVWLPTFTVTYVANIELTKGAAPTDTNEYKEGEFATAKTQGTMEATGYTFLGWSEDKNATTADYNYDPDAEFQVLKDTILYAVWEKVPTYTVKYVKNLDAASDAPVDGNSPYTTGSTVTILDQGEMKADGYQFMGWKPDLGSTGANPDCAPGKTFTINQDVTLYAVWVPTHTLTYDANGGENAPVDGKNPYLDGAFVIIAEQGGMTKGTDVFKGWSKDSNATEADDTFIPGGDYQLTEDTTLYAVWAPTYEATFDPNGGTNSPDAERRYEAGDVVTIPEGTPEKTGGRFDGWTLDPNDPDAPLYHAGDGVLMTEGGITLTAVWTDVYSVVYDPNGGANEPKDDQKYAKGEQVAVPTGTPTKEGFEFKGWSLDPTDPDAPLYHAGDTVTMEGKDITFSAVWSKINDQPILIYHVTYDPAGGVPTPDDTTEYVDGATVIISSDIPVYDGFTFGGWTQDPTDPNAPVLKGGNTTTISGADITFTAIWIPNYVVIYDKNAEDATGTQKDTSNPYESGETVTVLGAGTIVRDGYIFKGWTKDPAVNVASFVAGDTFAITEDTKLYAVWEAIPTYKVVYDPNGGSDEPKDPAEYTDGSTVTVSDSEPVKEGFIFEGWTLDPNATTPVILKGGDTTTVNGGDVTLTAVWKSDPNVQIVVIFKVDYDTQGGAPIPVDTTEYVDGATVIVTSDVPEKDGYVLDGWTLDPNAATPVILKGGETTKINSSGITFYAVWAPVYTVEYSADGASSTPKDEKKYRNGEKAVIVKDIPQKEGNEFKGWTLDPNDTTNLLQNGDTVTVDGKNIVVYAVFEEIGSSTYTVKYDLNGAPGTAPTDSNSYERDSSVTIVKDVPKRDGYTFTGWSTKIDGSTRYKGGDSFTITTDITFYAQWTPNDTAVKTGDPLQMIPWLLMALLSMAGASVAVIRGKRKEK